MKESHPRDHFSKANSGAFNTSLYILYSFYNRMSKKKEKKKKEKTVNDHIMTFSWSNASFSKYTDFCALLSMSCNISQTKTEAKSRF